MKIAAIARIGTMNSETLAPSGTSLPSMPILKAQVSESYYDRLREVPVPARESDAEIRLSPWSVFERSGHRLA